MGRRCRVRLKAGERQVTDGPFAETQEVLGGFYVIECDTKDEAVEWAKRIPLREDRSVEVRRSGRGDELEADVPRLLVPGNPSAARAAARPGMKRPSAQHGQALWHRLLGLLGRPASESGRLRHGDGAHGRATAPPEVMDLGEFRSNSRIPTLFPHRFPVNSHALTSAEGLFERMRKTRRFRRRLSRRCGFRTMMITFIATEREMPAIAGLPASNALQRCSEKTRSCREARVTPDRGCGETAAVGAVGVAATPRVRLVEPAVLHLGDPQRIPERLERT